MRIQTYICNKKIPVVSDSANKGIDDSSLPILVRMVPAGCQTGRIRINAEIIPSQAMTSDRRLFNCLADRIGNGLLEWTRRALFDSNGDFTQLETLITIDISHPADPCHRVYTTVYGLRGLSSNALFIAYPSKEGGMIPEEGGKSEVYKGDANAEIRNTQTQFVPGELLQLKWGLKYDGQVFECVVAGRYFASLAITGGLVLGSSGTGTGIIYFVKVQGHVLKSIPTDFAGYQADDWVYLLKQGDSGSRECDRSSSYDETGAELSGVENDLRLLPVTVNSIGNENGGFATLDYDMLSAGGFQKFFEISQHTGIVEAVDYQNDVADVRFNEEEGLNGVYSEVPIFYHCEDSSVVDGGAAAFVKNDEVIVLNEFGGSNPSVSDLTIVGHADGLRTCAGLPVIVISTKSGNEAFAWDIENNVLFLGKDSLTSINGQLENMGRSLGGKLDVTESAENSEWHDGGTLCDGTETTLPALLNEPDFFFCASGLCNEDLRTLHMEETDWDETVDGDKVFVNEITYSHSILRDPETNEMKGNYVMLFGWWTEDSDFELYQEYVWVHHLFDREEWPGWLRPGDDPDGEVQINLFSQLYKESTDITRDRLGAESGISSNSLMDVCFEQVNICDEWDDENNACVTDTEKWLRVFAKYRSPKHTALEQQVMHLVNFERENRGFAPFKWNPILYEAAVVHSSDMSQNQFCEHQGTDGTWPQDRIVAAGFLTHKTTGFIIESTVGNDTIQTAGGLYGENCAQIHDTYYDSVEEVGELEEHAHNIDQTIYEQVLSQPEYSALGPAERTVAAWMASLDGHRDLVIYDGTYNLWDGTHPGASQSADLTSGQYSQAEYMDCGISSSLGPDGYYYTTLKVGHRPHFWQGWFAVPTEDIMSYVDNNFTFSASIDKSEGEMLDLYLV